MDVNHDVEKNVTTTTGFSIDVFNTCIRALPYEVPYTFMPVTTISYARCIMRYIYLFLISNLILHGPYDLLGNRFYESSILLLKLGSTRYSSSSARLKSSISRAGLEILEIDAVVGDSTILANRSEYVDFTATYTDLGVGTLVRNKKRDMWFFLKPLDLRLWLTAIAALIFTALIVWAIECMNPDPELNLGIGTVFWLILSTIFFAQRDKLSSNLSKFVMFIWLLVVLVLLTSYTATLASLLIVEQFESASKGGIVGFHGDGDADAIVDEIPYIKMFLSRNYGDYALLSSQPITSGFAFIFQKGSPLVEDVSREIARIRLDGTLASLENNWFNNRLSILSRISTMPHSLKLDRFGGIFIIIAIASILSLSYSFYLFCSRFMEGFDLGIEL
ncbi:hypothetical protein LXL04_019060 [Taraxacum kok-saghyz]